MREKIDTVPLTEAFSSGDECPFCYLERLAEQRTIRYVLGSGASYMEPEIRAIVVEKAGLDVAGGAKGIGEITSIPTAPAIAEAYYQRNGEREFALPLKNTPYAK